MDINVTTKPKCKQKQLTSYQKRKKKSLGQEKKKKKKKGCKFFSFLFNS